MKSSYILALVVLLKLTLSVPDQFKYDSKLDIQKRIYSVAFISDEYSYESQTLQGNGLCNNGQANGFGNGFGNNGLGNGNGNGNGNENSCLISSYLSGEIDDVITTGDILLMSSLIIQSPLIETADGTSTSRSLGTPSIVTQTSSGREIYPRFLIISFCLSLIGIN